MPDLVQDDLFAVAAIVATNVAPDASPSPRTRTKKLADTTLEVGRARGESQKATDRARCLADIKGAGKVGRTRQELADRLGIPIQTVCWTVADLLEDHSVFEPTLGMKSDGRPIHFKRDAKKVLVADLYRGAFEPSPSYTADAIAQADAAGASRG